jgi:hypothetical protein
MLGLLDRATQLTSINGKEEHQGDRLNPTLLESGNGRLRAGIFVAIT